MTLEEALADSAGKGVFRLTLWPSSEGYIANLSTDGKGWRVECAADPVIALRKALGCIPGASGQLRQPEPTGSVFE